MPAAARTTRLGVGLARIRPINEEDSMRVRTGIIVATTVTALWSLALPAHAGDTDLGGGFTPVTASVTASDCTGGGGMVVDGFCRGGQSDGLAVEG